MRNILYFWLAFSFVLYAESSTAQIGGSATYAYLDLSPSARLTALGGYDIAVIDDDLNYGYVNPASWNPLMAGRISFSHAFYPAGIQHGHAAYAHHIDKWDVTMGGGILYRTYGQFDRTDPTGTITGSFGASEYVVQGGAAVRSDKLSYGANLKLLYSQLESYSSLGAAVDLGVTYNDTASRFAATLVVRNLGTQFIAYTPANYEELPFRIDLGISKRLKYLPLRLSLTLHDLQQWDIRYDDPNAVQQTDNIFGVDDEDQGEQKFIADKIFSHVAIGTEFYFGSSFRVRLGYSHQGRGELASNNRPGATGFSGGIGLRIKQFRFDYGHAVHHIGGRNHHISVSTSLSDFSN